MKKKRVLVFLSIAAIGTLAYRTARKKKTTALIRADNRAPEIKEDTKADDVKSVEVSEREKEEALEKILSDVEEMYRGREEIVPDEDDKEEVSALGKPESNKKTTGILTKMAVVLMVTSLLTGTTRGYTNPVVEEKVEAETIKTTEEVVAELPTDLEPEENNDEPEYADIPELIAKADETFIQEESEEDEGNTYDSYSEEDVYLLAQLIVNESGNQERDGQIGVAEVVLNRLKSARFPNTVSEVIYQQGQFSNNGQIKSRKPSEEIVDIAENVLNGDLRVFNNTEVLYFRNPMITSGISPKEERDWGRCQYFGYIGDHAFYLGATSKAELFDEDTKRMQILETAIAYGDKVESYNFGGKPNGIGDENTNMDLDCSGYVSWVLGTALDIDGVSQGLMGSANVNRSYGLTEIKKEELSVGDIGYRYKPGTIKPVNHCGIYIGNGEWIHCNSKDDGVVTEETDMFKYYYSAV